MIKETSGNLTVEAICRNRGMAILSNGERADITTWLDGNGDDCAPAEAVACVAVDQFDCWYSVDMSQFEKVFTQ